jgi:hypothetical protein
MDEEMMERAVRAGVSRSNNASWVWEGSASSSEVLARRSMGGGKNIEEAEIGLSGECWWRRFAGRVSVRLGGVGGLSEAGRG